MLLALYADNKEAVALLLARGAELDLFEASAAGDADRVEELLARGLEPHDCSARGWTPLHLAAFFGQRRVAEALLAAGADVNGRSRHCGGCDGTTALHLAICNGHDSVVALLIESGADVDARDDASYAPLHLATEIGNARAVKRLLMAGARVDPMAGEETPLGLAVRHRRMHIGALLRQCGGTT